ncbi:MAG: hypothetical protein HYY06_24135 [Deltaproteobacteria bacterium]|nr:hypothetical protein [Deltaproteobacteria bacterium]
MRTALLLPAIFAACTPTPRPGGDGARGGPDLRILFTTDLSGTLEPCGCTSRPLGGIDRMGAVVSESRRSAAGTVFVTAGATFFKADGESAAQDRVDADALARILDRLGLDAVAAGTADLAAGPGELARIVAAGRFALLAAGAAASRQAGEVIREAGGRKVGIFGIADPSGTSDEALGSARASVERLSRGGAQVVIGLASAGRRSATRIAQSVPGIDFIVVGGVMATSVPPPQKVGDAHLLFGGRDGQGIGIVDLTIREDDPRFVDAGHQATTVAIGRLDRRIADLETRIHSWERARDAGVSPVEIARMRERLADLRRERDALTHRSVPSGRSTFVSRWEELGPERRKDPAVTAMIAQRDRRVAEVNRAALANERPVAAAPGSPSYIGGARCAECHEDAVTFWRGTKHAHAFTTLVDGGKELDLRCVGCHVTGYRRPGGSTALYNETLRAVQCEACHGPGSLHAAAGGTEDHATLVRDTPEPTCGGCHTQEHSDHFEFARYRSQIVGPGHGR